MQIKSYILIILLLFQWLAMTGQEQLNNTEEPIYEYVSQRAGFYGGDFALYEYLHNNIDFSQKDLEHKKTGPVQVNFVVEKDGSISNIELRMGLVKVLNKQVLDAVRKMPKWVPAKLMGKVVRSYSNIRVEFNAEHITKKDQKKQIQSFQYPIQRAMYAMEKQLYRQAVAYFSMYLSEYEKDSFALYYRGGALYNLNRHREACIDWKDAQSDDSKDLYAAFCEGMRGVKYYSSADTNYQKFLDTLAIIEDCSLDFDSVAHFSNNPDALRRYYKKNMKSWMIKEYRVPRVVVSFNVLTDGKIENVWIVRSFSSSYDQEAMRLIRHMPKWEPATKEGKAVKSKVLFQIIFNDKSTKTGRFIHDFFEH